MYEQMDQVVKLLNSSEYAIALTGAGISTESGIQDYRGPNGVWTKDPSAEQRAYKSYEEFIKNPDRWWKNTLSPTGMSSMGLAKAVDAQPNAGHYILAEMEAMDIIKCTITQNVDSLHEKAGTKNLIEYHGSMAKLRCLECGKRYHHETIDLENLKNKKRLPPTCPECGGILKTDGVFFGEPIPKDVTVRSLAEASRCDLMLVCGTSAVVYPFASLPRISKERGNVTIIEINAESTPLTMEGISNIFIQGQLGDILPRILEKLKTLRDPNTDKE